MKENAYERSRIVVGKMKRLHPRRGGGDAPGKDWAGALFAAPARKEGGFTMRSARMAVVAASVIVLALAGVAHATGFTDSATGGNWQDSATWNETGYPDAAADTATIDESTVVADVDVSTISGITVNDGGWLTIAEDQDNANTVTVNTGGVIQQGAGLTLGTKPSVTFDGGTWRIPEADPGPDGPGGWVYGNSLPVTVAAGGMKYVGIGRGYNGQGTVFDGAVGGSGTITVDSTGVNTGFGFMALTNGANTFSGPVDVTSGAFRISADGAVGSGTVTVKTRANPNGHYNELQFGDAVSAPNAVNVTLDPTAIMRFNKKAGGFTVYTNTTMSGATVIGNGRYGGGTPYTYAGTHTMTGDCTYELPNKSDTRMEISAKITESGGSYKATMDASLGYRIYISNSSNDYSGGTDIIGGTVVVGYNGNDGKLGTGPVWVQGDATLQLMNDGIDDGAYLALLSGSNGFLDLDDDATVFACNLGGSLVDGEIVGGTWLDDIVYDSTTPDPSGVTLSDYIDFGSSTLTVLNQGISGGPIPEPAGVGVVGLALLALRRRRS
jgi:MYXO-CTERM domain-containing protein